ncbi:MAG: sodium:solute symporter family transporter [Planctomycetota bacterium]|jgi:SSS family solute:Na+ symporter
MKGTIDMDMDIHGSLKLLDFVVIAAYILSVLSLGFWVSFRKQHTDDLFLAGRRLGWANIGLSIFGTNVSPSMLISSCGIAYSLGMVGGHIEWLAWFFLLLLAMVFIPHYLNTKVSTMPQFMNLRFNNSCREFVSYYTIFATLVLWLGGNLYAGGVLLGQIMNWPVWVSLIFLMTIATSFTVAGGLAAVVITDSFQSILMIVVSAALTIVGLVKVGSIGNLIDSVPGGDFWKLFRPASDTDYPWHAVILGYPVIGIWFWCTDQTIVQRVLGGRNIRQSQLGTVFAGFLKILTPLIFFVPGILCRALHPGLDDPDKAYMTMVANYLPVGIVGLIVAVLIAALVSTVDSGLNSLSTVFTLDIYVKKFKPDASQKQVVRVGRLVTLVAAVFAVFFSLLISSIKDMDLFSLLQSIIGYLAPPMAAVFLIGVLWKRATSTAALATLILGSFSSIFIAICDFVNWPSKEFWPHFLLMSFYIFAGLCVFMVLLSLYTKKPEKSLPSLKEAYLQLEDYSSKVIWRWWIVLAVIMVALYVFFQFSGTFLGN